jgi:CheY-like chemotaxis protein
VILSDLNMPEMQGLDFVAALMAKHCAVAHIALLSGAWSEADKARAAGLGCQL